MKQARRSSTALPTKWTLTSLLKLYPFWRHCCLYTWTFSKQKREYASSTLMMELVDNIRLKSHNECICIKNRAVDSESLKVGKSLKIGKNRIKSEKSDLISYPTFWQKCQNAINCHKMPKCPHFGSGSCIRIFFWTFITLESEVLHRWDAS